MHAASLLFRRRPFFLRSFDADHRAGFPWAPAPAPFHDPNGDFADDDDRERHYFYSMGPDGPLHIRCQAARICYAKDLKLFQTQSWRFKKDHWDECEEDGTQTCVMLWDDWNGYRGEGVMVKKTCVLCPAHAAKWMELREERRCQNPKRPECLMLAIESDEGMKEFGPALKEFGPRLCFRCVCEYAPPQPPVPEGAKPKVEKYDFGTKTYHPKFTPPTPPAIENA